MPQSQLNAYCSLNKKAGCCKFKLLICPEAYRSDLSCRFNQADVRDIAQSIIDAILAKVESAGTPEKIAENDYLMKCEFPPVAFMRNV